MKDSIVKVKNLDVFFGKKHAVKDLSVNFRQGETVLIAGRNGAGKSTFLRCLGGQILPDSGTIDFSGLDKKKIGIITDRLSLYEKMTLNEALEFHSEIFETKKEENVLLNEIKIDHNKKITELSSGERAVFHLSILLSQEPQFLMVDEVIYKMDAFIRDIFLDALIDLLDRNNSTLLMVNHTFSDTGKIPERILIMDEGKIILDETREDLFLKVKKVSTGKSKIEDVQVIFSRSTELGNEYFIYPYSRGLNFDSKFEVEDIGLNEIVKAFLGGSYAKERI